MKYRANTANRILIEGIIMAAAYIQQKNCLPNFHNTKILSLCHLFFFFFFNCEGIMKKIPNIYQIPKIYQTPKIYTSPSEIYQMAIQKAAACVLVSRITRISFIFKYLLIHKFHFI